MNVAAIFAGIVVPDSLGLGSIRSQERRTGSCPRLARRIRLRAVEQIRRNVISSRVG